MNQGFDLEKTTDERAIAPDPIMMRVYNDGHKGATAFFRNRPFLATLFSLLTTNASRRIKVLVHSCSLGAEPYSLALWWEHKVKPQLGQQLELDIAATDIDPSFLAFAREATYPEAVLAGMTAEEIAWFNRSGGRIQVPDQARGLVRFLQPMNFVDAAPEESFDAVLVMNALTYVTPEDQSKAIRQWATYTDKILGVTAFHPDSIMRDLSLCGFQPCLDRHREIHEAWGDRLVPGPVAPKSPNYSWQLPPYDRGLADSEYRYGAVFLRTKPSAGAEATCPTRAI